MTEEKTRKRAEIKIWIDYQLKETFKKFCSEFNISLTDLLKISATHFINIFKRRNPLTLNVFTTDLKNVVRSKQIKVLWDFPKQSRYGSYQK